MSPLNLADVYQYVEKNIGGFHANRLDKINRLKLDKVLLRKNPYLFKAKYTLTAESLVRSILDAYLSSQEETIFGDFMEGVAIFVCGEAFGGYKPEIEGIDLVFERDDKVYIVEIKSGPNWGNSSSIKKMIQNFRAAQALLASRYSNMEIIAINGCSYGSEARPHKKPRSGGEYWKLCGQDFWSLISGNEDLYTDIIEPLGHQAKIRNEEFEEAYARVINLFTINFANQYCTPVGNIDWELLVRRVSQTR